MARGFQAPFWVGSGTVTHARSCHDTVLFQGMGTTGKLCCVSPLCLKHVSLPRNPEKAGLSSGLLGRWGKHPAFPSACDFSGQHTTAVPNLKNDTGVALLRIFTHTLTGLHGLTRLVFPKENK